jgi:hypothetical protein
MYVTLDLSSKIILEKPMAREEALQRIADFGGRVIRASLRLPSQTKQKFFPEDLTDEDKKALKDWEDLQKEADEMHIKFPG